MDRNDPEVAQSEFLPILQVPGREAALIVLTVIVAAKPQFRAGLLGEASSTSRVVRVYTCFQNVGDPQALLFRRLQIWFSVSLGVDDYRLTIPSEHVGVVCQPRHVESFQNHEQLLLATTAGEFGLAPDVTRGNLRT